MRLIDADALIDELGISDEDIIFEGILEDAPTIDAVPVVRCKDCKHCEYAWNRIPTEQAWVCYKLGIDVEQDWFCADGERKDTMSDYIKREDAKNAVMDTEPVYAMCKDGIAEVAYQKTVDVIEMIDAIPSADVAPVRHGRWAETVTDGFLFVSCSACGFKTGRIDHNYCPNCGAKMDEGGNDGTDD